MPEQGLFIRMPHGNAAARLASSIREGESLLESPPKTAKELAERRDEFKVWDDFNRDLLSKIFTTGEISFEYAARRPRVLSADVPIDPLLELMKEVSEKLVKLRSIERRLELYQHVAASEEPSDAGKQEQTSTNPSSDEDGGDAVFLVHGHDNELKETVARFIERFGLKVVILHEQAGRNLTIIEKLESIASEAVFAVVLLTPDDKGGAFTTSSVELRPRARQNVILELGYFLGLLGRSKVCALKDPDVEEPSDFRGVEYVPIDPLGAWKMQLGREMKAARLDIDMNKAL